MYSGFCDNLFSNKLFLPFFLRPIQNKIKGSGIALFAAMLTGHSIPDILTYI